jgi:hypothetical protein
MVDVHQKDVCVTALQVTGEQRKLRWLRRGATIKATVELRVTIGLRRRVRRWSGLGMFSGSEPELVVGGIVLVRELEF